MHCSRWYIPERQLWTSHCENGVALINQSVNVNLQSTNSQNKGLAKHSCTKEEKTSWSFQSNTKPQWQRTIENVLGGKKPWADPESGQSTWGLFIKTCRVRIHGNSQSDVIYGTPSQYWAMHKTAIKRHQRQYQLIIETQEKGHHRSNHTSK